MSSRSSKIWAVLALLSSAAAFAAETPVIPVGLDAYRQWERWPWQRIGARAFMRSTYDRRGGNEGADASHFLYQLADDYNVTLDVAGPGVLYFARYNHWHGSPWHYEVDGADHLVRETGTADPVNAKKTLKDTVFLPETLFPNPLAWTWATTKGADLMWVPLPFERSFRMGYSRTRYGTGYYIYHLYDRSAPLSQPIRSWDGKTPPDKDVLALVNRAGADLVPLPDTAAGREIGLREWSGTVAALPAGGLATLLNLSEAPAMLRALEFSVPQTQAVAFGRARLRVTWDQRSQPSIDAPVALFFGAGTLYNRDGREFLVKGFPMTIRQADGRVHLACYFPMPFFKSARLELQGNATNDLAGIQWRVRAARLSDPPAQVGYFHATYRDHPAPELGQDLVLLDTRQAEGGGDWAGSFVGTSWIFSHRGVLNTLEGDPRFFFDDSQTPQAYGTGTEEWGGGGDYWGGLNMTLPFAGHPVGARNAQEARGAEDLIESAYRFLLADLMPFGHRALIRLEHGGENQSTEHYETVTYWYGAPGPALVKTDELQLGDAASERAHRYESPQASAPYEITSRYEWGVDTVPSARAADEKPPAQPTDYAEFEFTAAADTTYTIWVCGKNLDGRNNSDAFWIQFDDEIGTDRLGPTYNHPKGFGNWLDRFPANTYAWSSALPQDPPQTIVFRRAGKHRLRLQPRHPKHILDQIWLSPTQKELPGRTFRPKALPGEVLLLAGDAVKMQGGVKLVSDPESGEGKVLEIGGSTTPGATVIYPPHTDRGRTTRGASEFSLKLRPDNFGVVLRRKLDYAFPNQRAEVFVADETGGHLGEWKPAGVWYLAGANTCVYSNPPDELGATRHIVQTSNRRFRDDEFIVPRDLTRGRSAIRVRVQFTPVAIPLFPGHPLPELAWSEIRYTAYCWVLPQWEP